MIKIANVKDVKRQQSLPQEVVAIVERSATILDNEYGVDRDIDGGDGRYVLVIEAVDELEQLKDIYIEIDEVTPEFLDVIAVEGKENYSNTLILFNNDFGVSLIMPESLLLKRFLE